MVCKPVASTLRVRLMGLAHVRTAGDFGWPKICWLSFVLTPLEGASICAVGREAQQTGLMVRATSMTALFPCAGPSPHLLQLLPTSLWTTNDHKEQTSGECFKTKRRFQYSLTYSICSRMNDMQLRSCSSGCLFREKIKSDMGRWRGGKAAESGVSTEMM